MDSVDACFDGREPRSSYDTSIPRFTWWLRTGSEEWVVRQFDAPRQISSAEVYWFDDTGHGGCRGKVSVNGIDRFSGGGA
jgi:hypothetical protein